MLRANRDLKQGKATCFKNGGRCVCVSPVIALVKALSCGMLKLLSRSLWGSVHE